MSAGATKKAARKSHVHEEPSAESLREIPPLDPETAISFGRGAEGLARAREFSALMRSQPGRPRRGAPAPGSAGRTVRLPDAVWAEVERFAEKRGVTAHAIMREAIVRWVLDARAREKDGAYALVRPKSAKPRKRARRVA
jgi:hypothetical protein